MMQTYYRHKLKNLLVINKVITIHDLTLDQGYHTPGEAHDFWEMVYVESGTLLCRTDGKDTVLQKGEIVFHKPNEHHAHLPHMSTPPRLLIVSFECKSEAVHFFEGKRLSLGRELSHYLRTIIEEGKRTFDIPVSDPKLKKMPLNPTPPLGGLQLIKNLLELLLIHLMREETQRDDADSVFLHKEEYESRISDRIREILSEHLYTTLSVDELAGILNYNKSYLFRQFKASTGQTIMSCFNAMKLEEAKRLLDNTDLTVSEISSRLAFDTPNYFSKSFRRLTGLAPTEYRRRGRK